jgi:hypothetical protein
MTQCKSPNAKEKFQQISIAYTKLISAQSVGGKRLEDEESGDEGVTNGKRGEDSHEMAAFMRMFMDLVGIFNEDQALSEDGVFNINKGRSPPVHIPIPLTHNNMVYLSFSGVSFMFGPRNGAEEWSTDDEDDEDDEYYDSDDEDDDDDDGDYVVNDSKTRIWEAPAKQYSNMNLKESASKERGAAQLQGCG